MVARGLHGIENELELAPEVASNAYDAEGMSHIPLTLRYAVNSLEGRQAGRKAFGDEVVDHYAHAARAELAAFDAAVTDWELVKSREHL